MRLIDADALMTELSTMYKEPTSTEDFMAIGYDKAIADVVVTAHRQPTVDAQPKWIPVTERLPERGVSVLISHVGYVSEDYLDIDDLDGAEYFWDSGINLEEELKNLAWMPLPEPWKGGVE